MWPWTVRNAGLSNFGWEKTFLKLSAPIFTWSGLMSSSGNKCRQRGTNIFSHWKKKVSIGIGYWTNIFCSEKWVDSPWKNISFYWEKKIWLALDQINRVSPRTFIWSKLIRSELEADCVISPPPPWFNLLSKCSWTEKWQSSIWDRYLYGDISIFG